MNEDKYVTPIESALCLVCKYFEYKHTGRGRYICDAFPNGIPPKIMHGDFDHRNPHPKDNGIRFELDKKYSELPDWVEESYRK
jgi:hypothetical protein